MSEPQCDVLVFAVRENLQRLHLADAARQVRLSSAKLAEHDLDPLIDGIEGHTEQWIVAFLRPRANLGAVDLKAGAASDISAGEIVEHFTPAPTVDRQRGIRARAV